jgi:hypothetical protein
MEELDVYWLHLAQDMIQWRIVVKSGEYLDYQHSKYPVSYRVKWKVM